MRLPKITQDVSRRMRAVRRRDTAAEKELQRALSENRLRFTTHPKVLGCCPDIVLLPSRIAVFVDGDFWHGRLFVEGGAGELKNSFRKKAQPFWIPKITRNAARDRNQTHRLRRHGWCVLRFWEQDILSDARAAALVVGKTVLRRMQ
jgi:DNA mismatch endonuclease (patch repair protein)